MTTRGRKPIEISKEDLQAAVDLVEGTQEFSSQQKLWAAVAETEWARGLQPRPLTAQTAYLRAKTLGITTKTGKAVVGVVQRAKGSTRRRVSDEDVAALRKVTPPSLSNLVDKVAKGNLASAIRLNCLVCTGFQPKEIRDCDILSCPFHSFRPYKPS